MGESELRILNVRYKASDECMGGGCFSSFYCRGTNRTDLVDKQRLPHFPRFLAARCSNRPRETLQIFGRLDVLVNNAGVINVAPLDQTPESDFDEAMATQFWAPLRMMKAAQGTLKEARGRIVNVS